MSECGTYSSRWGNPNSLGINLLLVLEASAARIRFCSRDPAALGIMAKVEITVWTLLSSRILVSAASSS
jgi:hypothetical protein